MTPAEDVPEADRLEQEMPPSRSERAIHRIPPDAPDADVLEQDLPLVEEAEGSGVDADRIEPLSDEDWASTSSGG